MRRAEADLSRRLGSVVRLSVAADGPGALGPLLNDGDDVATLSFPHRSLSLTHAGRIAVAARAEHVAGVGVDYEPWREVDLRTARFFLRPAEQVTVTGPRDLLRRWTVKEALFKATPGNGEWVLMDFEIADPHALAGGVAGPRGETLRYACVDIGSGHLAVAVCGER